MKRPRIYREPEIDLRLAKVYNAIELEQLGENNLVKGK
jgi:hypothetical protein